MYVCRDRIRDKGKAEAEPKRADRKSAGVTARQSEASESEWSMASARGAEPLLRTGSDGEGSNPVARFE